MDIAILSGNTLKVKGKNSSIVINPTKETGKTDANCILKLVDLPDFSDSKIEGSRITISGSGQYEVGGIKISVFDIGKNLIARIDVESIKILVGRGEALEKIQEKVEDSDILLLNSEDKFNYSIVTSLDPKIVLEYGANVSELEKALGKSNSEKTHKFVTTVAKLPTELQFIHLG